MPSLLREIFDDIRFRIKARIPLEWREALKGPKKAYLEAEKDADLVTIKMGHDRQIAHGTWYRGEHTNFLPTKVNMAEINAIDDYILKGWVPSAPFITRQDYITTFGSCFAAHITNYLRENNFNVFGNDRTIEDSYVIRCGEGMVNTFSIAQQFLWAYGEKEFETDLWHDKAGEVADYIDSIRDHTRQIFEQTDVFVITLGLSEVWYDKKTGDVYWRAIPRSKYDPERHGFKVTAVSENQENLETIYRLIRRHRPNAAIVITLSPVPLVATFRPVSCLTANSVSKAILRAAVDEFKRAHDDDTRLFYFPSYELVTSYFRDPYEKDNRHIRKDVVRQIMQTFHRHFLVD